MEAAPPERDRAQAGEKDLVREKAPRSRDGNPDGVRKQKVAGQAVRPEEPEGKDEKAERRRNLEHKND